VMDTVDEALLKDGKNLGIQVYSITDIEAIGSGKLHEANPPSQDDVATICYTSGTTGLPKGVVLTHTNILSFAASAFQLMSAGKVYQFTKQDSYLSYLPLAHIFERCVMATLIYAGAQIGFYQGDTLKLLDDVAELKPTIFASVPRLYNRIYDKVMAQVSGSSFIKSFLFKTAFAAKKANLGLGHVHHFLWDWLVFSKIRAKLGGRVKMMMSGAAPISPDVMDFLRICFSATVQEGYGQTETSAGMTLVSIEECFF
jgi:long-chain acyl-CoA synthetase